MTIPPADSDRAGFIYALEVAGAHLLLHHRDLCLSVSTDAKNPHLIHIKVGRTNDIQRRLREHRRTCPSMRHKLLGFYPPARQGPDPGDVPFCDRLERLVHIELTDLAVTSNPARQQTLRWKCKDCKSSVDPVQVQCCLTLVQANVSTKRYSHSLGNEVARRGGNGLI